MKRILESCFVLFLFLNLSFAADVEVKLTTNDGTTKFAVQDSGAIDVAGIDSDGNMILEGTATIKGAKGLKTTYGITAGTITLNSGAANVATIDSNGNMILEGTATIKGAKGLKTTYGITAGTITLTAKKLLSGNTVAIQLDTDNNETVSFQILSSDGNEKARIDEDGKIFPGSSFGVSNVRYIYDDTTNYATRFSSNVYVSGAYGGAYAPITVYPMGPTRDNHTAVAGIAAPADSTIGWSNNAAYADWQYRIYSTFIDATDHSPIGKIQIKVHVQIRTNWGGDFRFRPRDANTDTGGSDGSGSGGETGTDGVWFEGTWSDFTFTDSPHEFRLQAYMTNTANYYCIYKAILLVRAKL